MTASVAAVITTFRRPAMLARAIRSVLKQTVAVSEIIIVDDGNDPKTKSIVDEVADTRVTYYAHPTPKGGSASRNTGVALAKAEVIAFLDDDDLWLPEKIERQLADLGQHEASVTGYCYMKRVGARCPSKRLWDSRDFLQTNVFPTSTLMARREALLEVMFDERLQNSQDWDVLLRLSMRQEIVNVALILAYLDAGLHQRITTSKVHKPEARADKLSFSEKHKFLRGAYWTKYGNCEKGMNYLGSSKGRVREVGNLMSTFGVVPVLHAAAWKILDRVSQVFVYFTHHALMTFASKKKPDVSL